MVELVELNAVEDDKDEDFVTEDEADDLGVKSEADNLSDDEDEDIADESIWERLYAFADIIPYSKRRAAYLSIERTVKGGLGVAQVAGKGLWILATGALILVLPVALEIEREHFTISQENAQRLGQVQAQAQE
ncbi:hypothetical protein HDU97_002927 [Phlyctochytrium planicorne]|nr:hypothetical protein HDU97_002927 [Phlyctochytrium planicorne]